jgi:hypothetical protein
MKQTIIAAAMGLCLMLLPVTVFADTLILSDGTRITGLVVSVASRMITFEDSTGVSRRYSANQVESLLFSSTTRRGGTRGDVARLESLPNGTEIEVRTVEDIDSSTAGVDQTFSATVERDVIGSANTVIVPEGSHAVLVVRSVSSGGVTGSPDIVLDIQSLTVGTRRYVVSTSDLIEDTGTGIGKNKRTAETIGGGAALGALIGAIAGGGKGAAIGVLVGGAGGAGVEVLNKGKDVRVPAETLLRFRLDRAVSLQSER